VVNVDSCLETTTADWVFSVSLSSGAVALITGLVWLILLSPAMPQPAMPRSQLPGRRSWGARALTLARLVPVGFTIYIGWSSRHQPYEALIELTAVAVLAYPVIGMLLLVHRSRRTGQVSTGYRAPLAMFWLLPVLFLAAVITCGWSIQAQVISMVPCR
jgi:hypothetical protein